MAQAQFFLREGGGFVRTFDTSALLFTTVGTAAVSLFTADTDHPHCMIVSADANSGADGIVSQVAPNLRYVFEAAFRTSGSGKWRANLYDVVNGATIWSATTIQHSQWANLYKVVTMPAACSVVRIRFQKASGINQLKLDDIQLQGNLLLQDPDQYQLAFPQIGTLKRTANGRRVNDIVARHVQFNMGFPNISASGMSRIVQGVKSNNPMYLADGNELSMTDYGTVFVSKTYNFNGVSQGGGGATIFRTFTTAQRPVASDAFEDTQFTNGGYTAVGTDNDTAATVALAGTGKYGYLKMIFQATDYATTGNVKSITLTAKAGVEDLSDNDVDGAELYAWDGTHWTKLDVSRIASKQTLTFATSKKAIARRFVDVSNNNIRMFVKSRGNKDASASLYMRLFYGQATVNDRLSGKIPLTNKAIPTASGAVDEVRNLTSGQNLKNQVDYRLGDDRKSVILQGVYANLDGAAQYLHAGDNLDGGTGDVSLSAWVRRNGNPAANEVIIQKWVSGAGYSFYIDTSGRLTALIEDSGGDVTGSGGSSICDNEWHHVAVTFDRDGNMTRYVDGVIYDSVDDISARTLTVSNGANFVIGANSAGNDLFLDGDTMDVKVLIGATLWTAANILAQYRNPRDVSLGGGVTSSWRLDDLGTIVTPVDNTASNDLTLIGGTTTNYETHSRTVSGASNAVIRVRYNQYYEVALQGVSEPTVYGGPINDPRGVGRADFVTLTPID